MSDYPQPNPMAYGCRSWLYMVLNYVLGVTYFSALLAGFATAFGLSIVWIGIPFLVFMFAASRRLAVFDRWLAAALLGIDTVPLQDDINVRGRNILTWAGAYLSSATTWQRVVYLLIKLPLGMVSITIAMMIAPLFVLELLLNLLGINTGMMTGQLMRALAAGLSGVSGNLIQTPPQEHDAKSKNAYYVEEEYEYGEVDDYPNKLHQARPLRHNIEAHDHREYFYDEDNAEGFSRR